MPIATPEVYAHMIDRAKAGKFAYPAINVTSSSSINAGAAAAISMHAWVRQHVFGEFPTSAPS